MVNVGSMDLAVDTHSTLHKNNSYFSLKKRSSQPDDTDILGQIIALRCSLPSTHEMLVGSPNCDN